MNDINEMSKKLDELLANGTMDQYVAEANELAGGDIIEGLLDEQ